jgi:chorismate mutase/prephenate dehydratase
MSLSEHRQAIDKLDAQIVRLLNERTRHVLAIGEIKLKAGEEIYAPHRERAVFERVCGTMPGRSPTNSLRAIYREIMSSALALEKTMTIAYFGPEATFTHQAAIQKFGSSLNYAAQKTIGDVFAEVSQKERGLRRRAGGKFHRRRRHAHARHVRGQRFEDRFADRFAHAAMPDEQLAAPQIKKLYVHPQSLAQCRGWLQKNLPRVEIIETSSNARSAELAAKEKFPPPSAARWPRKNTA